MADTPNLKELLSEISEEELNKLLKKKGVKTTKTKTPSKVKTECIYQGRVTLTCFTCGNKYNEFFNANEPDIHLQRKAVTCTKCAENLKSWDKDELIKQLIEARRGTYKCIQ